jgi:3-hydroxyacyl-[acyl-carrier-protein] dehydratase
MRLLNDFFSILDQHCSEGNVRARLIINKEHTILKGHFPGQPVVPGVCMMQMIKELLEFQTRRNLRITEADNMKFLSVIDPDKNNQVDAHVSFAESDGLLSVNASLSSGDVVYFKLKAILADA